MSVKSANRSVRASGRQAASSRWLLWLARLGFVARGVTYVLISLAGFLISVCPRMAFTSTWICVG